MPIDTTAACCSETVNSAISLWTELEIVDEDDDLYTYHTLDTNSFGHHVKHNQLPPSAGAAQQAPSCLKRPTIGGSATTRTSTAAVDPSLKWQEEAYWMSFRDAVRSFSDNHCVIRNKVVQAQQEQSRRDDALMQLDDHDDDDDHGNDLLSLEGHHHNADFLDDGFPPCLPRTVVTPTASIAASSHNSAEMSVASQTVTSTGRRQPAPPPPPPPPPDAASFLQRHPPNKTSFVSDATGSPLTGARTPTPRTFTTEFTVLRQNLHDLAARSHPHHPHASPGSVVSGGGGQGQPRERRIPRGDWTVSESLAGPNADELKGIRWRMKLLAEQAAAIRKGDQGAEQYVVCPAASSALSSLAGIR